MGLFVPATMRTVAKVTDVTAYGATGNGTTNDTTAIQAAIDAAISTQGLLYLPPGTYLCGNLTLTDAVDLIVYGPGATITWTGTGTGSNYIGLQLVGTCLNVTISDLHFIGNGVANNRHAGIWTFADASLDLTTIKLLNNYIYNTAVGMFINADSAGALTDILIQGNYIDSIVGETSGHGYGILHGNGSGDATDMRIIGNHISRTQRHCIDQTEGRGVTIVGNTFRLHRTGMATPSGQFAAVAVANSSDVTIEGNIFDRPKDGAVEVVSQVGPVIQPQRNVLVRGNMVLNPVGTFQAFTVGSTIPATDGVIEDIVIEGNSVYQSAFNPPPFRIYSGKRIRIANNQVTMLSVTTLTVMIDITAKQETTGTANYTQDVVIEGNTLYGTNGSGGDLYPIGLQSLAADSAIRIDVSHNRMIVPGTTFYTAATLTNTNIRVVGTPATGTSLWNAALLGPIDTGTVLARYGNPAALTVTTNAVTITGAYHRIDTSGGVQTLKTITGGNIGDELTIQASSSTNALTVDETGNIVLGAATRVLDNVSDVLKLIKGPSAWCEIAFADNA